LPSDRPAVSYALKPKSNGHVPAVRRTSDGGRRLLLYRRKLPKVVPLTAPRLTQSAVIQNRPMKVAIIHNDPRIVRDLPNTLRLAGHLTRLFTDPTEGWDYLKARPDDDALVTRADFGADTVNGLALAHVARSQISPPLILFIALPQWAGAARELGEFLELGTPVAEIVSFLKEKVRPGWSPSQPIRLTSRVRRHRWLFHNDEAGPAEMPDELPGGD
jgi:hypothetical protein